MSETIPTPITDAVARSDGHKFWATEIVDAEHMRVLERQLASFTATLAAKDRLLERMAGALREIVPDNWEDCPELHNGCIAGEYTFGDAREARAALKEHADTTPNPA